MAMVDFEKGDSSTGVTLMRDEGESKDCARMRTLGDGVCGGAVTVSMFRLGSDDENRATQNKRREKWPQIRPGSQRCSE